MIAEYIRDENLNVTSVCIEMPIKTEYGWATAVIEHEPSRYVLRGTKPSGVYVRLSTIDQCPDALNERKQPFPEYSNHRIWSGEEIREVD